MCIDPDLIEMSKDCGTCVVITDKRHERSVDAEAGQILSYVPRHTAEADFRGDRIRRAKGNWAAAAILSVDGGSANTENSCHYRL
jgi:hypothetical protein